MIAPAHQHRLLAQFSHAWPEVRFERLDLNKPIVHLTPSDLAACLRKRCYLDPVIDLVHDCIRDHWAQIDRYYVSDINAWYEEVLKEIVTLPYSLWDNRHSTYHALRHYIAQPPKWRYGIEPGVITAFLNYQPKPVYWTLQDAEDFASDLHYGLSMDILGNLLAAERSLSRLKTALLHGQAVWIESEWRNFTHEAELLAHFAAEYADYGEGLQDMLRAVQGESRIQFVPGL
jgi:hypothetical protein